MQTVKILKQCGTCLDYQETQAQEKTVLHDVLCKPGQVAGIDIFSINNNIPLCVVDYYSKFSIMQRADGLSADDLMRTAKFVFAEFGLSKKIVSC